MWYRTACADTTCPVTGNVSSRPINDLGNDMLPVTESGPQCARNMSFPEPKGLCDGRADHPALNSAASQRGRGGGDVALDGVLRAAGHRPRAKPPRSSMLAAVMSSILSSVRRQAARMPGFTSGAAGARRRTTVHPGW
jgi:hypothetical protein